MIKTTYRAKGLFGAYGSRGIKVYHLHSGEAWHQAPGMVAQTTEGLHQEPQAGTRLNFKC